MKNKGKKVGEGEQSHHHKEKKNKEKKEDEKDEEAKLRKRKEKEERKERRHEERRLKKEEEKKKKAASPEMDGESTSVREDRGEPVQLREPVQPKTTQLVATNEGKEGEDTPLMRRRKENVPQMSTVDPSILINAFEEEEMRRKEEEER
ncbi:protein MNN4-like [Benincasa hispida]|uniref:protein MNN4-like n=1 Tax=Benincasa hispida TaxID=102211 RepID=UPI0018FFD5ED|nr:protein MNN4-like [Benincasa hispida]